MTAPTTTDAPVRPSAGRRLRLRAARLGQATRRGLGNRPIVLGLAILLLALAGALAHPILTDTLWASEPMTYRPEAGFDLTIANHPSGPSARHWLGTDPLGRDVTSMLLFALRPSLIIAVTAALTIGVVSVASASASASLGGRVDGVLSSLADGLLLLPAPIVLIIFGFARPEVFTPVVFGATYGVLVGLSAAAIVLRTHALQVMAKPFIQAARVAGGGRFHIVRKHLVPHLLPLAAVQMTTGVVGVIVAAGFVEFLGASRQRVGLGSMIYYGIAYQGALGSDISWSPLITGSLAISVMAGAFYLLSIGFRQLLDPRLRELT